MWRGRSKHVFRQRTRISWTACSSALRSVTPPGTWLEEKRGMDILRKTPCSSGEQTISPPLSCTHYAKQERDRGKGVSNLFPELRQSITPALPAAVHWTQRMCGVYLCPSETICLTLCCGWLLESTCFMSAWRLLQNECLRKEIPESHGCANKL